MSLHNPQCFLNHMGAWLLEPRWFQQAVASIKAGTWVMRSAAEQQRTRVAVVPPTLMGGKIVLDPLSNPEFPTVLYRVTDDGVGLVDMNGPMMKGDSKFGGCNSITMRRALRAMVADVDVRAVLIHADTPGGHVAGTLELAEEVKTTDKAKPTMVHADDLLASAGYWVASAARRIAVNAIGEVGSIGVVGVVEDYSKAYEMAGIKAHVVSTGAFKGAFTQGTEITPEQIAYLQELVDNTNQHFLGAVQKNRSISAKKLEGIADGRVFTAAKALELGLVDAVQPFEKSMADLRREAGIKAGTPKRDRLNAILTIDTALDA